MKGVYVIIKIMANYFKILKNRKKPGLPRPLIELDDHFLENYSEGLHKKLPVPWQSNPIFNEKGNIFSVIEENEKRVFPEGLCGYCSIKFQDDEQCVRWISDDSPAIPNDGQGPRVMSDTHPMHLECMKQARVYCPHMRARPESEFEYGIFRDLQKSAEDFYRSKGSIK